MSAEGRSLPNATIVMVGCGNMGFALLKGWSKSGMKKHALHVIEPVAALRDRAAALGVTVSADASDLPGQVDLVIFAVKPQVLPDVVGEYRRLADAATFVSIAAGVTLAAIEAKLGLAAAIRVMPNTPASIGKGSLVLFANERVTPDNLDMVKGLLAVGGAVHCVEDEAMIDAVTAISGSGPAYLFHVMECLHESGKALGLPDELALSLARETVFGAGALAVESTETPQQLRRQVTSPNGTTAAALDVLMENGALRSLVGRAADAAYRRSAELAAVPATRTEEKPSAAS